MDDYKYIVKALSVGNEPNSNGEVLQIESLDTTLMNATWPSMGWEVFNGYEEIDLHGKLKIGSIHYTEALAIFQMFEALAKVRIIKDAKFAGGERMYVDSRPYVEEN